MLADRVREAVERGRDIARNRELVDEYGDWFKTLAPWGWFVTITDRYADRVSRKRVKEFLADLQAAAGGSAGWVVAYEHGVGGGHLHSHLLISGVDELNVKTWCRHANARFGSAHIDIYDPSKAGARYVAKAAFSRGGAGDYEVGGNLRK